MGKLLPGGGYQADNGLRYRDYQSAVNAGNVDRALKQVGSSIFQGLSNPLGLINQFEAARKSGFGIGRPANAGQIGPSTSLLTQGDPTGRYAPVSMQTGDYNAWRGGGAPPAPILPPAGSRTPITSPNTTFQNADEEYKTLLSQYGGTSGVQQLAGMQSLPIGFTPTGGKQAAGLEDYYSAQRAVGSKNIGEITGALAASDPRYQKGGTLERWAIANPDLAMREFNKKFPAGAPTQGTGQFVADPALQGTTGSFLPGDQAAPTANPPSLAGQTAFGNIANPVAPATALNQGATMDANRGKENLVPQQAAKTTPDGAMPNLPTTLDKVSGFLNGLTPVIKAVFPAGAGQIFGPRY